MITLYTWARPNGYKVTLLLEELDLPYAVELIDLERGAQHAADFLTISPNGKIPALHDTDGPDGAPITLFESGLILLYLADKTRRFVPSAGAARYEVLKWLFWQVAGEGPWIGLYFFFRDLVNDPSSPVVTKMEADALKRLAVLETRLGEARYLGGEDYSIADIACYVITRRAMTNFRTEGKLVPTPNLDRWVSEIEARPAARRGTAIPAPIDWVTSNGVAGWEAKLAN